MFNTGIVAVVSSPDHCTGSGHETYSLASGVNRCCIATPQWKTMELLDSGCYNLPNPKGKSCMPFESSVLSETL